MRQQPSRSKSITMNALYQYAKATNRGINDIRWVTFQLSQLTFPEGVYKLRVIHINHRRQHRLSWDHVLYNSMDSSTLEMLRSAPKMDQGRFTRYARYPSSNAPDGNSNRDCLLPDPIESPTILMMLEVHCSRYGSLTRLYTSSDVWCSNRRSCGSSIREV